MKGELTISETEHEECRAWRRETVTRIFEMEQLGILEDCIKGILKDVRTPAMYKVNTLDISVLFSLTSWYRELAPYALPNGETLDFTRAEIEEYFGESVDWLWFCGMKEDQKGKLPPIYFFRDPDKNPRLKPVTRHSLAGSGARRRATTGK